MHSLGEEPSGVSARCSESSTTGEIVFGHPFGGHTFLLNCDRETEIVRFISNYEDRHLGKYSPGTTP
jgi:hypothetical protein